MVPRFLIALILFAFVNLALAKLPLVKIAALDAHNFVLSDEALAEGKPASWWLARLFLTSERPADVVVCGSSQIGGLQAADANTSGQIIDLTSNRSCITLENDLAKRIGAKPSVFLSALPGAMVSDHFAIGRALYQRRAPSVLVLTVSPRDFIDNTLSAAGATDSYRYFSQYSDMTGYTDLAFHEPWSRLTYFVSTELPVRRLIPAVNQIVGNLGKSELLPEIKTDQSPKKIEAVTAADQLKLVTGGYGGNLRPGQAVLRPNLPKIYVDNTVDYMHRYSNAYPPSYAVQLKYMQEFLADMKSRNIKVLVVGMPLTAINRALLTNSFWDGFKRKIAERCKQGDASYIDLSDSPDFTAGDFCDTVHLNADGGAKLAQHIADAITQSNVLRTALEARLKSMAQHGNANL